ncbi:ATP-binding cassette domain-containing protein [Homoserinimonas sp. OAct 916]|uniref:ATP-binding cassette domain-containing protein n=1 Tax=Homoserinimonas sp. OAct 916 TaxID=2211450 RepID=UPI000DBEAA63|nr:ATP-binding cassette domain-containing protein [Homoserinimonas sp. OAct 916]
MPEAFGVRNVFKSFGHVEALRGVSLAVSRGEIVALLGDNGAGKSTLVKTMCGVYQPDSGSVELDGSSVRLTSSYDASDHGIEVVYQDLALVPDLSIQENIFLAREIPQTGWRGLIGLLDKAAMSSQSEKALETLAIRGVPTSVSVNELSGGQRQAVAIARSVLRATTALLLDEPTAALGVRQSDLVCDSIVRVAESGLAVLVISHDLERMLRIATRIVVLRRGQIALDEPSAGLTVKRIVEAMMGETAPTPAPELGK